MAKDKRQKHACKLNARDSAPSGGTVGSQPTIDCLGDDLIDDGDDVADRMIGKHADRDSDGKYGIHEHD